MDEVGRIRADIATKSGPFDRVIARLAEAQHGVVAIWQLQARGMGRGAIKYHVACGRLHQLYRGVYAVGHTALSLNGRLIAAVFSAGANAVLSHRSAAMLWGLLQDSRSVIDVTTADRGRASKKGVRVHRVRSLHPEDVTVVDSIPVTSLARTLFDIAVTEPPRQLRYALDQAERLRLLDLRELERFRGCKGWRRLAGVLASMNEPANTQEGIERLFLDLCEEAGLPRPETNVLVEGYLVDAVWREQRLIVELDSRAHHMTTRAFEEDRERDETLQLARYRVIRITWRRLTDDAAGVVARLRAHLDLDSTYPGDDRLRRGRLVGTVASRGPR
jgi:predicted transcriptional regulator of viral defense system